MSADAQQETTATAVKDALFNQVTSVVTGLLPSITDDVKDRMEAALKKTLSGYLDGLKKEGKSTASEITAAGVDALAKLKKELNEAADEIASKQKTSAQAISDAMSDWANAMTLDPKIVEGIKMIPDIVYQIGDLSQKYKDLKNGKGEITIRYTTFVGSLLGVIITMLTLVVLVMQIFGK